MMYGYRKTLENGLMTNLNSISSSLSSIDSIGRRNNTLAKSSVDNLINQSRSQSVASTSALYRSSKDDRYPTMTSAKGVGSSRYQDFQVYHNGQRSHKIGTCCPNSQTALNLILTPLLLLTILRQVFDFLGQIWLQILINLVTILIIILALFGIKQHRLSYLVVFMMWALINTIWNLMVILIHSKTQELSLTEDFLSLYTGGVSWWHSNGPGCLPYTFNAPIQHQSVSILSPKIITGCRIDHHLLESTQAALHASLSLIASIICCFAAWSVRVDNMTNRYKYPANGAGSDKPYRMNDLSNGRSTTKVNHDPYPSRASLSNIATSRFVSGGTSSLRRTATTSKRAGSRSSQHSLTSARRRNRQLSETSAAGVLPTPKGSTSSAQRSQMYGSLSSRRSRSNRRLVGGDVSSLTYASSSANTRAGTTTTSHRNRLSSLSSADYLPSYQPPHSSSANLLNSYGEISSIDSYTNRVAIRKDRSEPNDRDPIGGSTNPTYNGSRSSVYSHNLNNYDDINNVYGNNHVNTNGTTRTNSIGERTRYKQGESERTQNGRARNQVNNQRDIQVEIYQTDNSNCNTNRPAHHSSRANGFVINGGSFQSFSSSSQQNLKRAKMNDSVEMNNNYLMSG